MAKSSRKRRPQVLWDSGDHSFNSCTTPPKKKIKDVTISMTRGGHASSHTTYITVKASPTKAGPLEPTTVPIKWIRAPPEDHVNWVDDDDVDPDHARQHLDEPVNGGKKKKASSVSFHAVLTSNNS